MNAPVQINVETLAKQVNEGMKKVELAKFYNIPVSQMGNALKGAGLKIRKFHAPAFVLVSDGDAVEVATEAISSGDIEQDVTETTEVVEVINAETPSWNN